MNSKHAEKAAQAATRTTTATAGSSHAPRATAGSFTPAERARLVAEIGEELGRYIAALDK